MCTGFEIAALAATVGGSALQYKSQNDAQDRQKEQARAELTRQAGMDKEKFANFQQALSEVGRADQQGQIDKAAAGIEEDLAANVNTPGSDGTYTPASADRAPKIVQEYAKDKQSGTNDFISALGNAQGRLGAWGENQFDFAQKQLENQFNQGQIQTNMDRSAQIGRYEAEQAGRPGSGSMWGNALAGLGTAGLGYAGGLDGAFGTAAKTVAPTATATATAIPYGPDLWSSAKGVNIY